MIIMCIKRMLGIMTVTIRMLSVYVARDVRVIRTISITSARSGTRETS